MTTLPLQLYAAATGLLEPLAPGLLRARARRGKEDAARLGERLGRASAARPRGALVWLHGVSVGESLSLLPLAQAIAERRPDLGLLITTGTRTAAALMAERMPAGVIHQYAPVDTPGAVGRFLDHWRPSLGLFGEGDLWPNLIAAARRRDVRLALVSARMTEASARGWRRAPASARALLGAFELILPQDAETQARLTGLGAVCGPRLNLKQLGEPLPFDPQALAALEAAAEGRTVVIAVSTHAGEEALIARAFRRATAAGPRALLVVAPRHPDRGPEVMRELASLGLAAAQRSAGEAITGQTDAYVVDTLGELGVYLRAASIAVMGGAFVPGVGGHNPLEPARCGLPILTGPHADNARGLYAELFAEAAAIEAADEAALARHLAGLMAYPQVARRMGEAATAFAARQGGELDRAMALLAPLLAPP